MKVAIRGNLVEKIRGSQNDIGVLLKDMRVAAKLNSTWSVLTEGGAVKEVGHLRVAAARKYEL